MATKKSKIPSKAMQKRIMKTGEVSDADVLQYVKQVGFETLESMSLTPENIKEYLKNVTELGNPQQKKKLPAKNKIADDDSIVVVGSDDKISKVSSKESGISFKSVARKTGEGVLDLGSAAFNKMFPSLGKFMSWAQTKLAKQEKNAAESNSSIRGYSRQVSNSSSLLDSIVESQNKSNNTLQKILNVIGVQRVAAPASLSPTPGPTGGTDSRSGPVPAPASQPIPTAPAARPAPPTAATRPISTPPTAPMSPTPPAIPRPAPPPATPAPAAPSQVSGSNLTRNSAIGAGVATAATVGVGAALGASTPSTSVPATAMPSPSSTPTITSFSLQAFRQDDPEGAREYEDVVKTRTGEIEQQLNARIPANADRLAIEMHREANKAQAESAARREAMQQFAERIQRTQPQTTTPNVTASRTPAGTTATPVETAPITTPATVVAPAATRETATPAATVVAPAATQETATPAATVVAPAITSGPDLTPVQRGMVDRLLRDKQLQDDRDAKELAETIVRQIRPSGQRDIDERILESNFTSRRIRLSPIGMLIAHQPVIPGQLFSPTQMAAIETGIAMNSRQRYPATVLEQYDRQKRGDTSISSTPATPVAAPTTTAAATPVAAPTTTAAAPATPVAATPAATTVDSRLLHIKAKEIIFKAGRFEYPQEPTAAATTPAPIASNVPTARSSSTTATTSPSVGSTPATSASSSSGASSGGGAAATPTAAANLSGLEFAAGVDQRIKPAVAEKTKEVQSAFGRKLVVTSGFRDPARNTRAGGASGSKHLTADAVDVQFPGNEQDTINLIKVASEKGMGGIGVYRPGFLHLDTGSKRVWGPDYTAKTIPQWAKPALDEHMGRPTAAAGGGEAAGAIQGASQQVSGPAAAPAATPVAPTSQSTPSAPSAPATSPPPATPAPAAPSSGAAVSRASTADEVSTRMAPPALAPADGAAATTSSAAPTPGLPAIDPNNPGEVEPADAAQRYARLFNMAA